MKKQILYIAALGLFTFSNAQDLYPNQVPSVILNEFNSRFPNASDVEWEMKGALYNVEFETGWDRDHEVWYDPEGKIVRQKDEITAKELPEAVSQTIKTKFKGYRIDDVERISDKGETVYKVEVNSLLKDDWDLVLNDKGELLSQTPD
ncbi:PepSY-like domain-containing protein [Pseudozobellia thermophila]|uniref:Putative beta-lactamase-inhibitor-like, PepSY-like n=1 Tax=Pseudozobellia thermophila TaxID=192903 RepID=A0A1M6JM74_9FLAO|nr:PepSY-like domain-containing protein [Pseudozobellia thermophila]SHJ47753.1 Putative beta-lactamase-inhibitor-like, PepSY-like [Pseudozobellia thermophila]